MCRYFGKKVQARLCENKGISAVVVVLAVAVIVMAIVVAVPYIKQGADSHALTLDSQQESAAAQAGRLFFAERVTDFMGIFDPDTKLIVEIDNEGDSARRHASVEPYGMAKSHEGMVIVVSVNDGGDDIRTIWSRPSDIDDVIVSERARKGKD